MGQAHFKTAKGTNGASLTCQLSHHSKSNTMYALQLTTHVAWTVEMLLRSYRAPNGRSYRGARNPISVSPHNHSAWIPFAHALQTTNGHQRAVATIFINATRHMAHGMSGSKIFWISKSMTKMAEQFLLSESDCNR